MHIRTYIYLLVKVSVFFCFCLNVCLDGIKSDKEQLNGNYKEEIKSPLLFPINLTASHVCLALIQSNGEMKAEGSKGQSKALAHHRCPTYWLELGARYNRKNLEFCNKNFLRKLQLWRWLSHLAGLSLILSWFVNLLLSWLPWDNVRIRFSMGISLSSGLLWMCSVVFITVLPGCVASRGIFCRKG